MGDYCSSLNMGNGFYRALADLILVIHFGVVVFVVGGFLVIWIGFFRRWGFVRRWPFRLIHLGLMGIVVGQAFNDRLCPLTTWENRLRELAGSQGRYESGCVEYWVGQVIYYDVPPDTFRIVYAGFFLLLVVTMIVVRPGGGGMRDAQKQKW